MPSEYDHFMSERLEGCCATCGFLGKMGVDWREHPERYWDVERATLYNRQMGNLFFNEYNKYDSWPECFVNAAPIADEVVKAANRRMPKTPPAQPSANPQILSSLPDLLKRQQPDEEWGYGQVGSGARSC